jgi:hypothetical protein
MLLQNSEGRFHDSSPWYAKERNMKISVTSVSAALIASTLSMGTVSQAMDSGGKYEAKENPIILSFLHQVA